MFEVLLFICGVAFSSATYSYSGCKWVGDNKSYQEGELYFDKLKCTHYECIDGQWVKDDVGCHYLGNCKSADETWKHDCITYKCLIIGKGKAHIQTLKTQCVKSDGNCMNVGGTEESDCDVKRCEKNNDGSVTMKPHKFGCRWTDDKCYEVGHEMIKDCDTHVCKKVGSDYKFQLSKRGCEKTGEKGCALIGEVWGKLMNCVKYTCKKDMNTQGHVTTRVVKTEGCRWKGKCYMKGDTVDLDKCNLLKCTYAYNSYVMKFESKGCLFGNACKDRGSNWKADCVEYECPIQKSTKNYRYVVIFNGCKDQNNKCRTFGDKWTQYDSYGKVCTSVKCGHNGLESDSTGNCYYKGVCYKNGDKVPSKGKQCQCKKGKVKCLEYAKY